MKKIIILGLIFVGLSFCNNLARADVLPPDSHQLERCVKIENLDKFPDIVLIGYYTGPMIDKYEAYQIKNDECLTKEYKFNKLKTVPTTSHPPRG